jgi:hypothetical protein
MSVLADGDIPFTCMLSWKSITVDFFLTLSPITLIITNFTF